MMYFAELLILGAHTFVLHTLAGWAGVHIPVVVAAFLSVCAMILNGVRYKSKAQEPWPDALGYTGFCALVLLLFGWLVTSIFGRV